MDGGWSENDDRGEHEKTIESVEVVLKLMCKSRKKWMDKSKEKLTDRRDQTGERWSKELTIVS